MSVSAAKANRESAGFTMIEVLVTLVILMIGLLGIAGLMAQGQRASFEAYQRQQALALANDMAERVKANRPGVDNTAVATTYAAAVPVGTPAGTSTRFTALTADDIVNCATSNCTTSDMVEYDAAIWDGLLAGAAAETERSTGAAIGPLLNPRGCIQTPSETACVCGGAPASRQVTYRISVAWQGSYSTFEPAAADTCGSGLYNDPRTGTVDDAFRRLVSVDVYTVIPCACP
ncbi:MAG: type IV pilus modification protein PilV [Betaproteobacteria bacterium]|nr:type IV pilus modification protein PilV [Betaproteobacteria bacterium]